MRIHHFDCATMIGGLVTHCLLIETSTALVLVDTGFGTPAVDDPRTLGFTRHLLRPRLTRESTAVHQVAALGYAADAVTDIVLTHLDFDHAGGLVDFPAARVHVHGPEWRTAQRPRRTDRLRYHRDQWAHGPRWVVNEPGSGQLWHGFRDVAPLDGLPEDLLVVPLYGHTNGHVGVAIDAGDRILLHAGDAFVPTARFDSTGARIATALYGSPRAQLYAARWANSRLLATAASSGAMTVFTSHDPTMFAQLSEP